MSAEADDEPEFDFTPWTPEGADAFQATAREAATALLDHADRVAKLTGDADVFELFTSADELAIALAAFANAQFAFSGVSAPLGSVHQFLDEGDDELDVPEEDAAPVGGVSVFQRRDYAVANEAAILAAGREAYLRLHDGDSADHATASANHVGAALYQIAHESGTWDSLAKLDGLSLTGGTTAVVRADQVLGSDEAAWPENPFEFNQGDVLFGESDIFFS